ncbi:MAG: DUF3078 domain-containing protein [Calditrichaeota bacterium]|nr:MAG: DUF3078 domain-containing protein [Calditrichota bacterium]
MKIKKYLVSILSIMLLGSMVFAQEQPVEKPKYGWQKEMVGGLNLTQNKYDNWAQGGENSFAWQLNLNFKFNNDQEKTNWANSGKLTYGSTKTGEEDARKSIDEIKLESVFTYKINDLINPYIAATGETQFAAGYVYGDDSKTQISAFFDPGYFRESLGIGYKPNKTIKTRAGLSLKQTITSDYPVPYADDVDTPDEIETTRSEIGAESVTDLSWKVAENTLLASKLELFTAFAAFDETDVSWDNVLTTKINQYINMNFNFKLFYDKDISSKRQIKQAFALGLTYNFLK